MLQMVKHILLIASSVAVCSCNQLDLKGMFMPTGEGVEKRFEQSMLMNNDLQTEGMIIVAEICADPSKIGMRSDSGRQTVDR